MVYKRGAIFLVTLLFFVSFAIASHTASVSTTYIPIYETTSANTTVSVTNSWPSMAAVNNVVISANGFSITASWENLLWLPTLSGNSISYYTPFAMLDRATTKIFGIEVAAQQVSENTTFQWNIATTDTSNDTQEKNLSILVIDDSSPPEISNTIPQNNSFIREGTKDQLFSMDATDPETGVQGISAAYGPCGNLTNNVQLVKSGNTYSSAVDLSSYADSTVLCYIFTATNNGGSSADSEGIMTIDGTAPTVQLAAPAQNAMMNSNSEFRFIGNDNLAPTLTCTLYADDLEINTTTANRGEETTVSVGDSPEGEHSWYVACTDLVGLSNSSETRTFTLDKTPPLINVTSPAKNSVNKAGVPIVVEVADNYNVSGVWYEYQGARYDVSPHFSINTENGTDGINTILITAADSAGNVAVLEYTFTIDKAPPQIQLVSPAENETVDLHVPYRFVATDNYDPLLDCKIYAHGKVVANGTAPNGNETLITGITEPGTRTYYIECTDDAENSGTSESRTIDVQDLSPPDILIDNIGAVERGQAAHIRATITDYSGVQNVSALITDSELNTYEITLSKNGDIYTADFPTDVNSPLGTYTLEITASDSLLNSNTARAEFQVVVAYVLTMQDIRKVHPKDSVLVKGNVRLENGTPVSQSRINLVLPLANATAGIDPATGDFAYTFEAPSKKGDYEVAAWIVSEYNVTYTASKTFEVYSNSGGGGHGGGDGGGHATVAMPEGNSGIVENNTESEEENKTVIVVNVPNENAASENSGILEKNVTSDDFGRVKGNETEEQGTGIGKATSFLSALGRINWAGLLWIVLLVLALALLMKMFSGKKKQSRLYAEMDDYIRKIRNK